MKTETFKKEQEWVNWFENNKKLYCLENVIKNDLGNIPIIKIENKEELIYYIDKIINIICEREKKLYF